MSLPPIPRQNPVTTQDRLLTPEWDVQFFVPLVQAVDAAPYVLRHVRVNDAALQFDPAMAMAGSAAIAPTPFVPAGQITTAMYRISHAIRISRAATTSSSVQLQLTWTSGGVGQTETYAAITGNTTTTWQDGTLILRADANTAINFELFHSSVGAQSMLYNADITLERMP